MKKKKTQRDTSGKKGDGTVDYSILLFGDDRPDAEKVRGLGVLLEDIDSKMSLVIEKVDSSEERLTAKIDDLRTENNARFDTIEGVLKHHTKILNEHGTKIACIETAVTEHTKILKEHSRKLDEHTGELAEIKKDVSDIKTTVKHLDAKVSEKLDDHEQRIVTLEKSAILP